MKSKKIMIAIISTLLAGIVYYYFLLPPLNITSSQFWSFFFFLAIVFFIINFFFLSSKALSVSGMRVINASSPKWLFRFGVGLVAVFAVLILTNIFLSPFFHSKSYSKRITVDQNSNFLKDVALVDFTKLPLLDKDSSQKLGDRVMGQMPELVSQFTVSDLYTQINYRDQILRVTPLEYDGFIKYFTNRKNGVKGYITVNSVDGKTELTKLDKGMKYMPSSLFNENLYRKLRFQYPTTIFGKENFELDNEGNPYWIIPTLKFRGIGLKREVTGVVILDPITGKSKKYKVKDVPTWVDHVYSADLIIEQLNDWGKYKKGYWNSIFGQKNVVKTTEGYNYTVMNDDVYLYTGITSATSDEASLGFVLANMRTKTTKFYATPGAKEYSAMDSAKGQVQQMKYTASFPLLINLANRPTYLISLKDNAGLVKMYAFVDVEDYQKVVVTNASEGIEKAANRYLADVGIAGSSIKETKEIVVSWITNASFEGNTYYYIKDGQGKKYKVSYQAKKDLLPFIKVGDHLQVTYSKESDVTEIIDLELK